ncbi:MAG: ubiquinol-cytochrome C chaperone family protein [Pseudomonadota bacterium]
MFNLFRKNPVDDRARTAYGVVVAAARRPVFYTTYAAPDTVDGRFEVLTLHMYLVLRRLKRQGPQADEFAQRLFDLFFDSMDGTLRELGVGDMTIGKKVRGLAEAFYGRVGAFEDAFGAEGGAQPALASAIARNVFERDAAPGADAIAAYAIAQETAFGDLAVDQFLAADFTFLDPQTDAAP